MLFQESPCPHDHSCTVVPFTQGTTETHLKQAKCNSMYQKKAFCGFSDGYVYQDNHELLCRFILYGVLY